MELHSVKANSDAGLLQMTAPKSRRFSPLNSYFPLFSELVRVKGLEPPLPYGKQILSLPRLPFRHTRTGPNLYPRPRQGKAQRGCLGNMPRVDATAASADRLRVRMGGTP